MPEAQQRLLENPILTNRIEQAIADRASWVRRGRPARKR
jgi:hypothetical protein